jgi:solute carrier family 13 (sodium-dependent dicarboxylate transporter), member 2/3/5
VESILGKRIGLIVGPILFLLIYFLVPAGAINAKSVMVLAVGAWMVTWWITEAIPIPITAMLPLVLFPILGVAKMSDVAQPYGDPVVFLFMGGFILALGLEKYNLHQRIALNLIKLTGTSGNGIILGFMLATALISMWISNTATAIMMLPIASSVTFLLAKDLGKENDPRFQKFATGLMLGIAYSASIGGMGTIIGSPPNVVMVGFVKRIYSEDVAFMDWMLVGLPISFLILFACYFLITRILYRNQLTTIEGSHELIQVKLKEMGPLSKEEKYVLVIFSCTSLLWIFRQNLNSWLGQNLLDDTGIAMLGGLFMFLLPKNFKSMEGLLTWEDMKKMQWGILLLFGGGLALAEGMEQSGLVEKVGQFFSSGSTMSTSMLIFSLTAIALVLTELMSNVALVTIFIPVVFGIAEGYGINPIWLAMPVTFAASCAFTMPISTPPNAILFASGYIKMKEMIKTGIWLNLLSIIIIWVIAVTIMEKVFLWDGFPK